MSAMVTIDRVIGWWYRIVSYRRLFSDLPICPASIDNTCNETGQNACRAKLNLHVEMLARGDDPGKEGGGNSRVCHLDFSLESLDRSRGVIQFFLLSRFTLALIRESSI